MTIIVTGLVPAAEMERSEAERRLVESQDLYIASATRRAERGEQAPAVIPAGMPVEEAAKAMSWDFSPGWQARKSRQLRLSRQRGTHMPVQFRQHADGHLEKVYETDDMDLEPFRDGACCVRCHNWQPEDDIVVREKHRRLSEATGYRIPDGLSHRDACCYCGARLKPHQKAG